MSSLFPLTFEGSAFVAISVVIGFFFGFFLERAGFSSASKLTAQFYFRDWSVLKVMFGAIVVATLGLVLFSLAGWLDFGQIYIPETYLWPMIAGGLMVGAGFIVGGYCPGTSVAGAAVGRLDALAFLGGILFGIFGFGMFEPAFHSFNQSGHAGPLTLPQWLGVNAGVVAFLVAAMAVGAFWAAEKSEGPWKTYEKLYSRFAAHPEEEQ